MWCNKAWWSKGVVRNATVELSLSSVIAEELVSMDRKTRKILAVNGCLHQGKKEKGDAWYWVVCQGGEQNLHGYLRKSTEWVRMVLKEKVLVEKKSSGLPEEKERGES